MHSPLLNSFRNLFKIFKLKCVNYSGVIVQGRSPLSLVVLKTEMKPSRNEISSFLKNLNTTSNLIKERGELIPGLKSASEDTHNNFLESSYSWFRCDVKNNLISQVFASYFMNHVTKIKISSKWILLSYVPCIITYPMCLVLYVLTCVKSFVHCVLLYFTYLRGTSASCPTRWRVSWPICVCAPLRCLVPSRHKCSCASCTLCPPCLSYLLPNISNVLLLF